MISKRIKNISFGDTLYYIGTLCNQNECMDVERCDIGCPKRNTRVVKSFVVNQMRINSKGETMIGYSDSLTGFSLEEIFFNLKDKHEKFFFSKEEAMRAI